MEGSQVVQEGALVERAVVGDTAAFDLLVAPRLDRLYVTANRILRDPPAAEDVVQQTLIQAWRDLPSLRDPARFDAWLYRLLVHTCYHDLRARRRLRARVVPVLGEVGAEPVQTIHSRDALERAFTRLSPEQRAVVVLHHVTGFTLHEVAGILEVPEGTVRSRLHYGLRELRQALTSIDRLEPAEGPA